MVPCSLLEHLTLPVAPAGHLFVVDRPAPSPRRALSAAFDHTLGIGQFVDAARVAVVKGGKGRHLELSVLVFPCSPAK